MSRNVNDLYLLIHEPAKLIHQYDWLLDKIISRFPQHPLKDKELLKQFIIQRLPKRLKKLSEQINGESYVQTLLIEAISIIINDIEDSILLDRCSPQLFTKRLVQINARVNYYTSTGYIHSEDAADVYQTILQKLLEKLHRGKLDRFRADGDTLFSSYLFHIVDNLIKDAHKSLYQTKKNQYQILDHPEMVEDDPSSNFFNQIIHNNQRSHQLKGLSHFLQLFRPKDRTKFEICLKAYSRLVLKLEDITPLQLSIQQARELLQTMGAPYEEMSNAMVWELLNTYINIFEKKQTSPTNLRKWFTRKRNQLIVQLLYTYISESEYTKSSQADIGPKEMLALINNNRKLNKFAHSWLQELTYLYYDELMKR